MSQNVKCFLITIFFIAVCNVDLHASELKWSASTGEVLGYKIYYGTSLGSYSFREDVGNVTQYSLNNFSLSEGATYYFMVRAYNDSGESGDSNVVTYAVPSAGDTTPPLPPTGVSGKIISDGILLTWESNSEADLSVYRVHYGTSARDYGLPISVKGTEYSISGLESDVLYYFAVTAVDTSGNESGYSSPEVTKTISISKDIEDSKLRWSASTGDVSGYKVYFGTSEGNYTEDIDVGKVTQYSLSNLSLTVGIKYYFVVRAYNDYGETGNSNIVSYATGELKDTISPVITVSSPTTDTSYESKSTSMNIGGTASDDTGVTQVFWSNSRGGSGAATGTTNWSVTGIALAEGENVLTVTAKDEAGNTSTDALTVMYAVPDTTALVTSPTGNTSYLTTSTGNEYPIIQGINNNDLVFIDRSYTYSDIPQTFQNSVYIRTANDDKNSVNNSFLIFRANKDVTVYIAFDTRILTKPAWLASFTNIDGNIVSNDTVYDIYAKDFSAGQIVLGGNEKGSSMYSIFVSEQITAIPDTTAPAVTISSPTTQTSYETKSAGMNIGGTASDATGVTQVIWSNSRGGSGAATGTTEWSVAEIALAEGENVLTVTAKDEAGNTSTDALTVVYTVPDTTAPTVAITSPTTDTTYAVKSDSLDIGGTASDATGVTEVAWSNSRGRSGTATGTNSWSVAGIVLAEGENMLTVTAKDEAGNTSTDTLIVMYTVPDTTAPTVAITSPTTDTTYAVKSDSLDIGGTASDAIGVTEVAWSNSRGGSGTATGTNSWSVAGIALAEGENMLTVTAKDEAGNMATDALTVVYTVPDTTALVTSPTGNRSYLTASTGKEYPIVQGININDLVFIDRNYTYSDIPQTLQNSVYIRTANSDKNTVNNNFLVFRADKDVTVYIAFDSRILTKPAWLEVFTKIDGNIVSGDTVYDIYAKDFPAGPIVLGGNEKGFSMYTVFVSEKITTIPDTTALVTSPTGNRSYLTASTGKEYPIVEGINNNDLVFIDRNYTYSDIPQILQNSVYIRTANDDKNTVNNDFLVFRANKDVTVYIAFDSRILTKPAWLESYTNIDGNIVSGDTVYNIYAKDFPAGAIVLGGNEKGFSMYTVFVSEKITTIPDTTALVTSPTGNRSYLTASTGKEYPIVEGINNNDLVFIDRNYAYFDIPQIFQNSVYIRTANDDKNTVNANFLVFRANKDVTVYIALDSRMLTKPAWLASFTNIDGNIVSDDTVYDIYAKDFSAGQIVLGGNEKGFSMYTVLIVSRQ